MKTLNPVQFGTNPTGFGDLKPVFWLRVLLWLLVWGNIPAQGLEMGEDGPLVMELQQRLQSLGYLNLEPTGYFREATKEAVMQFQQDQGLSVDGVVGAETWQRLREGNLGGGGETLSLGDRGVAVSQLQERLQTAGFYTGPITGVYGILTETALKAYQEAQGLTPDGLYGEQTRLQLEGGRSPSDGAGVSPASVSTIADPYVLELQKRLQARGFYNGPLDGILGPLTQQAISKAQEQYGISAADLQ